LVIAQQLGDKPFIGDGNPIVKLIGMVEGIGVGLFILISFEILLFELLNPETVSFIRLAAIPLIVLPFFIKTPDCSNVDTPNVHSEGFAI
jgi:hypothetical protein